jgi:molecular chaperone DnaJ
MATDYYTTLGVSRGATDDEIKKAYRRLAHKHHPDKSGGDEAKFKEINQAYQVLKDKQKRAQYDQFGSAFEGAGGAGSGAGAGYGQGFGSGGVHFDFGDMGDLGDVFSEFFGGGQARSRQRSGPQRGNDLEMNVQIDFRDAVFGVKKEITLKRQDTCSDCKGNGARPGTKIAECTACQGSGQIRQVRQTILGSFAQAMPCSACKGEGKIPEAPCETCSGVGRFTQEQRINVDIPAGVDNDQAIRVVGQGEAGSRGGPHGDLFLHVHVAKSKEFERRGVDIYKDVPISFSQAALGSALLVKTLDGEIELTVPEGTQSGRLFRIKQKGVPKLNGGGRGDLYIRAVVVTPQKLGKREQELLAELSSLRHEELVIPKQSFFGKLKRTLEH